MGLFDRFKKRFKKTTEEEITAEEDSTEAEKAVEQGRQLKEALDENRPTSRVATPTLSMDVEDVWDDSKDITDDPFAKPIGRKERKKAHRAASVEKAKRSSEPEGTEAKDPMQSTTGHRLVVSGPAEIEVDLGDSATITGGRVLKGAELAL